MLKAIGAIDDAQLLTFRKFGSPIQGHPVPVAGHAVGGRRDGIARAGPADRARAWRSRWGSTTCPARVWVLMGDSEVAEGSVWEAMENASFHGARNLIGILDMNRLGQRGPTMLSGRATGTPRAPRRSAGARCASTGTTSRRSTQAYRDAEDGDGPTLIVARTEKGHGVSFLAEQGRLARQGAVRRRGREGDRRAGRRARHRDHAAEARRPRRQRAVGARAGTPVDLPVYDEAQATRKAFGEALAALAARPDVVALDGEVANSTHTEDFQKVAPERFFEMYIAEQAMLGAAVGLPGRRARTRSPRRSARS